MPIRKVKDGWTFGGGVHNTKAAAERSYRAYLAKESGGKDPKSMRNALKTPRYQKSRTTY